MPAEALHSIAIQLEGVTYTLDLGRTTENQAHDVAQAIANSETISRVDVYAYENRPRTAGPTLRLLYAWGRPEDAGLAT